MRLVYFAIVSLLVSRLRGVLNREAMLAHTDALTGLANNRAFYELIDEEILRSKRYGRPFTVAYIDLDNFKTVNDTQGHTVGDHLLQIVADTLRSNRRQTDILARLGGDEFAALFPETGYEMATKVIAKLNSRLREAMRDNGWAVTFSIGALTCEKLVDDTQDIVKAADKLMYTVKKSGKNNVIHDLWSA